MTKDNTHLNFLKKVKENHNSINRIVDAVLHESPDHVEDLLTEQDIEELRKELKKFYELNEDDEFVKPPMGIHNLAITEVTVLNDKEIDEMLGVLEKFRDEFERMPQLEHSPLEVFPPTEKGHKEYDSLPVPKVTFITVKDMNKEDPEDE